MEPGGRVYRDQRPVRLGDVGADGRLRLDAAARYLQDVAGDDSEDSTLGASVHWVVRRAVVEEHSPATLGEALGVDTFCSGLGSRWAERRTSFTGARGGHLESVSLWVHLDPVTGRPKPLDEAFVRTYSAAAGDRQVDGRLRHDARRADDPGVRVVPWLPRVCDLDVLDHVNNAVAWAVVEQAVAHVRPDGGTAVPVWAQAPRRVEVEYRDPIGRALVERGPAPVVLARPSPDRLEVTVRGADRLASPVFVTAVVTGLGADQARGDSTRP